MAADGTTFPPYQTIPGLAPASTLNFTDQVWISQAGVDLRCNIGDISNLTGSPVTSFNGRTGAVTLTLSDVTGVGGAPLSSPIFTNVPQAPNPPRGTYNTQIATTQFVQDAINHGVAGVQSWNGRFGDVVLTSADITGAGGFLASGGAITGPTIINTATGTPLIANANAAVPLAISALSSVDPSETSADPTQPLLINTTGVADFINQSGGATGVYIDGVGGANYLTVRTAFGTAAAPTPPGGGYFFGGINSACYDGSAYANGPGMYFVTSAPWSTSAHLAEIVFYTSTGNGVGGFTNDGSLYSGVGASILANNATGGFLMVPKIVGDPPSGAPVVSNRSGNMLLGQAPIVCTQSTNKLYVWTGSAWMGVGLAATPGSGPYLPLTGGALTGKLTVNNATMVSNTANDVADFVAVPGQNAYVSVDAFGGTSVVQVRSAGGTQAAPTNTPVNSVIGGYASIGYDGAAYGFGAGLYTYSAEAWASGKHGADLGFLTTLAGTNNSVPRAGVTNDGSVFAGPGNATLAAAATSGFLMVPRISGDPTGTPAVTFRGTALVGQAPAVFNPTTNKLWLHNGTTWAQPVMPPVAAVAHQWINSISAAGVPALSQPSTVDLSNVDSAQTAFTPTVTLAGTIGDGVFSGVSASGVYRRLGWMVMFSCTVSFTFTHTTAVGNITIGGFPLAVSGLNPAYLIFAVSPLPAAPSNLLIGSMGGGGVTGLITGNGFMGNMWGPSAGNQYAFTSGQAYRINCGGVYATNSP